MVRVQDLGDLELVADLAVSADVVVSVVTSGDPDPSTVAAFVRAGARDVIPDSAPIDTLVAAVRTPQAGVCLLPRLAAQLLAEEALRQADECLLTEEESDWLRELSAGRKVHEIAAAAGYSERSMFRLLLRIYRRLGARNRTEALLAAHRSASPRAARGAGPRPSGHG